MISCSFAVAWPFSKHSVTGKAISIFQDEPAPSLTCCSQCMWSELCPPRWSGPKLMERWLPPLWVLLDVHSPLSNPTVTPSAHIIHFFTSASFTMATSRHLRMMLSGTSLERLLPIEKIYHSFGQKSINHPQQNDP